MPTEGYDQSCTQMQSLSRPCLLPHAIYLACVLTSLWSSGLVVEWALCLARLEIIPTGVVLVWFQMKTGQWRNMRETGESKGQQQVQWLVAGI